MYIEISTKVLTLVKFRKKPRNEIISKQKQNNNFAIAYPHEFKQEF